MSLNARIVEAAGGVFTDSHTHEFQVLCEQGEDTIYYCNKCSFAENKEIATVKTVINVQNVMELLRRQNQLR